MYRKDLGQQGEQIVEAYLETKGYQLLERNYRKRVGEIDLISKDPSKNEIVFIEVKTRKSKRFGLPEEAVTAGKIRKIEKTAQSWLRENNKIDILWRIDIIALEINEKIHAPRRTSITHLENVTI